VQQLQQQPNAGAHAMVRTLAQGRGVDLLAHEAFFASVARSARRGAV